MRLRDIREDRDVKQQTVASYLHVRQNTYSQYETGQRQLPVDVLIQLAKFFHTSTDYILGLTDVSKPYPESSRSQMLVR
ncbi:MAG: helix-turn-helix transcriptional regulator [Oscillospiraceae bacterium]|nr:helix-turn-helix transcriptional regulator [Oscillospiraceae bacterium]